MDRPRLLLVGGFLGAGKTTLLAQAAGRLARLGKRVGLITNDQAANLVDTAVLASAGCEGIEEVAGGCFCCRFDELISAAQELIRRHRPDVIIGEPVGSCTDLSATVLQPIKKLCAESFRVAPFSVLVDTRQMRKLQRMRQALGAPRPAGLPDSVLYIYEKQLEEADLIVLNKCDTVSPEELAELEAALAGRFPGVPYRTMSALAGDGVDRWLQHVLGEEPAGQRIAQVDYDVYAEGESVLGWLNASIHLASAGPCDWRAFARDLLGRIRRALAAGRSEIAHLKLQLAAGADHLAANLTASDDEPVVRGSLPDHAAEAKLLLNARVNVGPDALRAVVERCLADAAGDRLTARIESLESFAPARPTPIHRYQSVV